MYEFSRLKINKRKTFLGFLSKENFELFFKQGLIDLSDLEKENSEMNEDSDQITSFVLLSRESLLTPENVYFECD